MHLQDFTGHRFNSLLVLQREIIAGSKKTYWLCRCDCGTETRVCADSLKNSKIKSCGCQKAASLSSLHRIHGASGTPTYKSWNAMMRRCYAPNDEGYSRYGNRGIIVVARWHVYENFLADMGPRPAGMTLDREDGTKGYGPGNCRWATPTEQARNQLRIQKHAAFGRDLYLWEWSEISGIDPRTLRMRLHRGMSMEDALRLQPRSITRKLIPLSELPWLAVVTEPED